MSLQTFLNNLHPSCTVIGLGTAEVLGNKVDAALIRSLYRQELVWGMFNVEKGKFKGTKLANSASTENVIFYNAPVYPLATNQ